MLSSICVATTTGLPARRAARVICFWMPGTFSSGISTPRSPRATISASARSMISSSRAHRLRLLDLGHHGGAAARDLLGLGDVLGPLHERQRRSSRCRRRARRRDRSGPSAVSAENGMMVSGRLTPLRSESLPPTSTAHGDLLLVRFGGDEPDLAVVEQQRVARLARPRRFPDAAGARASRRRRFGSASNVKVAPLSSIAEPPANAPTRSFGPCRSTRMPIGRS